MSEVAEQTTLDLMSPLRVRLQHARAVREKLLTGAPLNDDDVASLVWALEVLDAVDLAYFMRTPHAHRHVQEVFEEGAPESHGRRRT